jgi:hypothetical protein
MRATCAAVVGDERRLPARDRPSPIRPLCVDQHHAVLACGRSAGSRSLHAVPAAMVLVEAQAGNQPPAFPLSVDVLREYHPLDYAEFEGVIPAGEYGGGTVMVWDRGGYQPEDAPDVAGALRRGRFKFILKGRKLSVLPTSVSRASHGQGPEGVPPERT